MVAGAFGERKWRAAASGYRASFWNDENIMELDGGGGFPGGSDGKESACNVGDLGSIPGWSRLPGEGNGSPLQCSCLENSMHRGAWRATVHGVAKSQTQ